MVRTVTRILSALALLAILPPAADAQTSQAALRL
jgi:hypothetical protein